MWDSLERLTAPLWRNSSSGRAGAHVQLGAILGLLAAFGAVLLSCGPASPAVEPLPRAPVLQPVAVPATQPGTFPIPAAPEASPPEPLDVVDGGVLSDTESVASSEPDPGPPVEPLPEAKNRQAGAGTGAPSPSGGPVSKPSPQGLPYTWRDGDRTMTVLLQPDLTATQDGEIGLRADTAGNTTRAAKRNPSTCRYSGRNRGC